jgi:hypothetical protein
MPGIGIKPFSRSQSMGISALLLSSNTPERPTMRKAPLRTGAGAWVRLMRMAVSVTGSVSMGMGWPPARRKRPGGTPKARLKARVKPS